MSSRLQRLEVCRYIDSVCVITIFQKRETEVTHCRIKYHQIMRSGFVHIFQRFRGVPDTPDIPSPWRTAANTPVHKCQAGKESKAKGKWYENRGEEVSSVFSDIIEAVSAKLHLLRLCHLTTPSATPSIRTVLSAQFKRFTYQTADSPLSNTAHISFHFLQERFATADVFFFQLQDLFHLKSFSQSFNAFFKDLVNESGI